MTRAARIAIVLVVGAALNGLVGALAWRAWPRSPMSSDPDRTFREAGKLLDERRYDEAAAKYEAVLASAPEFEAAWFNLGLCHKRMRRWPESVRCNEEDLRLIRERGASLKDEPAAWNLGIAATALGKWDIARRAWRDYGLDVPAGSGPVAMQLGNVPIRIGADRGKFEVVWCRRLDPARAVVINVPFPDSGHRFGDLVLHDGNPTGTRVVDGQEVPVFDEIELITASTHRTFVARIEAPRPDDFRALEQLCEARSLGCEDWATVRALCRACSEGRVDQHPSGEPGEHWIPSRNVGLSSPDEETLASALEQWKRAAPGRDYSEIEPR